MLRTLAVAAAMAGMIAITAQPVNASCWTYKDSERRLASKLNDARRSRGLPTLRLDAQLSKVSRTHSWEMAKKRTLYHTPHSVLGSRVTRWVSLGENVGKTSSLRRAFRRMMDSAYHRANILDASYVHVGTGVVKKHGYVWTTITFEAVTDPGTTLSMC